MLQRHYSPEQKRALNMIWNAAGNYDMEPPFMAFHPDGNADFYFNTIIGLSMKYFDISVLAEFFASYQKSTRAGDFDAVLWLGMEDILYHTELPSRPVLKELRKEHAEHFFQESQSLSRQEMMARNIRVYEQEYGRWADVLQRKGLPLNPKARKLHDALIMHQISFNGKNRKEKTEDLVDHLQDILIDYFHFDSFTLDGSPSGRNVMGPLKDLLDKTMHREVKHVDSLLERTGTGEEDVSDVHGSKSLMEKHVSARSEADEAYIEGCFGRLLYSPKEMKILENELCRGNHEDCRLWITDGTHHQKKHSDLKEVRQIEEQTAAQRMANEAFLEKSNTLIQASIRRLSASLDTILATYMQPLPEQSKSGALETEKAWRLPALQDDEVFERPGDQRENDITVDLLLDGSASRMKVQESIASQAYILARSMMKVHIPVRIMDFHSLRGYTVLRILKDYDEKDPMRIFRYFAAGWNRDGLALRTCGRLMRKGGQDTKRILLIMTDAAPNDSTRMPAVEGSVFLREYDNMEAVKDTAESVKALREEKIAVGAVYFGPNLHIDNVHTIYGNQYVRVSKVSQLADGISVLLQKMLREMKN